LTGARPAAANPLAFLFGGRGLGRAMQTLGDIAADDSDAARAALALAMGVGGKCDKL
jgi:hypothetical protein